MCALRLESVNWQHSFITHLSWGCSGMGNLVPQYASSVPLFHWFHGAFVHGAQEWTPHGLTRHGRPEFSSILNNLVSSIPKKYNCFHIVFSVLQGIQRWIKHGYLSSGNLLWITGINSSCWEETLLFATLKATYLLEKLHLGNHAHRYPPF